MDKTAAGWKCPPYLIDFPRSLDTPAVQQSVGANGAYISRLHQFGKPVSEMGKGLCPLPVPLKESVMGKFCVVHPKLKSVPFPLRGR